MKKYFYVLIAAITLCFWGCKDKNEPSNNEETGVKNEFGEGRLIIGRWRTNYNTGGNYYFTFRSDGTCDYSYSGSVTSSSSDGYWSYDPETKTLASTMGIIGSMKINIMTPQALQGTTTGGTNYGLTHDDYIDANRSLIVGKWKTNGGTELVFDKSKNFIKDGITKGKYDIVGERGSKFRSQLKLMFDEKVYILQNLSGGFLQILTEDEKSTEREFKGDYYYVSE